MQQLLAMLLALSGIAPAPVATSAPVDGLVQASQQAPRVPLDQLIPVATQQPGAPASRPKPRPSSKPRPRQHLNRAPVKLSGCQNFKATVYGPPWGGIEGPGITATGIKPTKGMHLIAVDPDVIPLGSKVTVQPNPHGWNGEFLAADTGGAIQGHHIDVFMWQGPKAMDGWGVRQVRVCRS